MHEKEIVKCEHVWRLRENKNRDQFVRTSVDSCEALVQTLWEDESREQVDKQQSTVACLQYTSPGHTISVTLPTTTAAQKNGKQNNNFD